MRFLLLLCAFATPTHAWEFSPIPICTLDHTEPQIAVRVNYDPATALYAMALTRPQGWPDDQVFSIRFDGSRPLTISTARHRISAETLNVADTGFANVLNGLQFNTSATAFTATTDVRFSLKGAAGPIEQFRACIAAPVA